MHNHELVRDHIGDLLHEGDVLRTERELAAHRSASAVAARARFGVVRPARLRIGRWLVAIGWAVAGCPDAQATSGTAGRAV